MIHYKYLLTSVLLLLVSGGQAAAGDADELLADLDGLSSFSADFSQRLVGAKTTAVEPSSGRMIFKRPGKFRWIYETPYEQEIISDGKTLWVFDKDLEQVTIRPVDDGSARSPLTIFNDPASIPAFYEVESLSGTTGERPFKLTPKYNDAGFKYVVLTFADKKPITMEIYDNFEQHSSFSFHNIDMNPNPDETQFSFVPPADVDVIRAAQ